jgi:hypothetical protein
MDSNHRYRIRNNPFWLPRSVPQFAFRNKNRLFRAGDRWFESISLQRRVMCEPAPPRPAASAGVSGISDPLPGVDWRPRILQRPRPPCRHGTHTPVETRKRPRLGAEMLSSFSRTPGGLIFLYAQAPIATTGLALRRRRTRATVIARAPITRNVEAGHRGISDIGLAASFGPNVLMARKGFRRSQGK